MTKIQENRQIRPEPFFVSEHKALDLLSTLTAPWGEEIEWIENGKDLLDWLNKAELISAEDVLHFENAFKPAELDEVAAQARDLREWFRGFVETHAQHSLNHEVLPELGRLNTLLAGDDLYRQIEAIDTDQAFQWKRERRWNKAEDLLLPIAEAMGDLICSAEFSHIKNCEGPTCNLYFLDVSKNRKRRWCTMSVCGNRAKAAAHRARKKDEG